MRTYYFDRRDGVPSRDRVGLQLPSREAAIEHSKQMARRLRGNPRIDDLDLYISIIDESGAEIHREQVYQQPDHRSSGRASSG